MTQASEQTASAEDITTTEKCIRCFIIKSIQLIVQGRSGNIFNTNCMSDVGARNNMMIYLEDDPEIGATIKRVLQESGGEVKPGTAFALDILAPHSDQGEHLLVAEVWYFRLDPLPVARETNAPERGDEDSIPPAPHTDVHKSIFFERLGTLLKSILVASRLLPAYEHSRDHSPKSRPMFYVVRRGPVDVRKLGQSRGERSIGTLSTLCGCLRVEVHYRTHLQVASPEELVYAQQRTEVDETEGYRKKFGTWTKRTEDSIHTTNGEAHSTPHPRRNEVLMRPVRPAFTNRPVYREEDEDADQDSPVPFQSLLKNQAKVLEGEASSSPSPRIVKVDTSVTRRPLQLPCLSEGDAGGELSRLFSELKENVDLDLFHRSGDSPDSGPLSDDLERHETTLREFDDFMTDFECGLIMDPVA